MGVQVNVSYDLISFENIPNSDNAVSERRSMFCFLRSFHAVFPNGFQFTFPPTVV